VVPSRGLRSFYGPNDSISVHPRRILSGRFLADRSASTYKDVSVFSCGDVMRVSEKLRRGDVMVAACPSREVLQHVTSKWGILVLVALETGTQRFSGLRRKIGGVSERMLAQSLQDLEGDGLVDRVAYDVVPPHVEYSLTVLGREAAEKVRLLADWIEDNLPRIVEAREERQEAGPKPARPLSAVR
jgi:DNA-binding HxlR family transcriptional regulator